jgi:hypothetical protein
MFKVARQSNRAPKRFALVLCTLAVALVAFAPAASGNTASAVQGKVLSSKQLKGLSNGKIPTQVGKRKRAGTAPRITRRMRARLRHRHGDRRVIARSSAISAASGGGDVFTQPGGSCNAYQSGPTGYNAKILTVPAPTVYPIHYSGQLVAWRVLFYDDAFIGSPKLLASGVYYARAYSGSPARFPYPAVTWTKSGWDATLARIRVVSEMWWYNAYNQATGAAVNPLPLLVRSYTPAFGGYANNGWLVSSAVKYAC